MRAYVHRVDDVEVEISSTDLLHTLETLRSISASYGPPTTQQISCTGDFTLLPPPAGTTATTIDVLENITGITRVVCR